jgi:steroid 5-alpha reductase family enzyme
MNADTAFQPFVIASFVVILLIALPYRIRSQAAGEKLYDCMALVALSAGLMAANWFVLVSGVAVFSLLAARTATEEAKLLERFGDPYRAYRMRTGRFLPRRGATE